MRLDSFEESDREETFFFNEFTPRKNIQKKATDFKRKSEKMAESIHK